MTRSSVLFRHLRRRGSALALLRGGCGTGGTVEAAADPSRLRVPVARPCATSPSRQMFASELAIPDLWMLRAFERPMHPSRRYSSQPQPSVEDGEQVVTFPLAQPGEGIKECELLEWSVAVGDHVDAFQPICEVQSDKATVSITSRYTGRVVALHHAAGEMVQVGAPLVDILLEGAASSPQGAAGGGAPQSPSPTPPPTIPAPLPCDHKGNPATISRTKALASPAVRRIAMEHSLDLGGVVGTGPGGRVTKADVLALVGDSQGPATADSAAPPSASLRPDRPAEQEEGRDEAKAHQETLPVQRVPLRGYARAMVQTMTQAGNVPHFYFCDEVCMDALVTLRASLKASDPDRHARLTYLPFLLKAASLALSEFPALNSQLSADGSELLRFLSHNIGVAVATPAGLVVPNVKDVQHKTIEQISSDLLELQELAATSKLTQEHLAGGTITVSNIGSIGGTYAMPLVNVPEATIVALGRARGVLHQDADGTIRSRAMMSISWGADHRVVDGATLAGFSNRWKGYIEDPSKMMILLR